MVVLSSSDVGASLGSDSVTRSVAAGLVGLLIVVIFMISYYRLPGVLASVETFYKGLSDLIVRTSAVETVNGVNRPQLLDNAGAGRVYGLELLIRKELSERFFGWIAYTLSRSDRIDRPGEPRRLFDFDQTHNLTAVASYRFGNGWQLGGRYRITTGNPDTPVTGSRYLANFDAYLPIYGDINSRRLPTFNQLGSVLSLWA